VELPNEFKKIHSIIKKIYKHKLEQLKNFGLTKPLSITSKKDLIEFQNYQFSEIKRGNKIAYAAVSLTSQAIKLTHALELLETQGINSFLKFLNKIEKENSKASKIISKDSSILTAKNFAKILEEKNIEHPKLDKLKEIIKEEFKEDPFSKIIIFANYRDTVKNIVTALKKIKNAKPIELIGQKEGVTQKKQLETIKKFEAGEYNIIVGTSISEEGINIPQLKIAIFFDAVPSTIRLVQRTGRVGRLKPGKIIHIITKGTRDEAYHWKSIRERKKMKNIISQIQNKLDKQTTL